MCARGCVCVTPPPVTDARLFMCEVWECWVGRWVDTHVFASACAKGSVCVGGWGGVFVVLGFEQ